MVRRVFFSFHYDRDNWGASQVRNSWVTQDREAAGFIDGGEWEELKRKGDAAIKRWINDQLNGTSVTAVLIGAETADRKWVKYEIKKSFEKGNGLVGVRIHGMGDKDGNTDRRGKNPLDEFYYEEEGRKIYLSKVFNTYDWKTNKGYQNFGSWVEEAAKIADR